MIGERTGKLPRHPLNPRIFGVRLSVVASHYRARLRRQLAAELLAGAGIAIGVALLFGVLLASGSVTGSAAGLIRAVDGRAQLELSAHSAEGFPEALALRAGRLPGVKIAAFVLRQNAEAIGADGRRAQIELVGLTSDIATLHGVATQNLSNGTALLNGGIGLPAPLAAQIRARTGQRLTLLSAGDARAATVRAVLGSGVIGQAAEAPIALALLPVAQRLAGMPGRVSEVLIQTRPGATASVVAELRSLAKGRLAVEPADHELRVLQQAAQPLGESTDLFAAIGAMVGLLFAANAMLLTLPERRRLVLELFTQGADPRQIRLILLCQAFVLGLLASLVGLALGDLLAHTLFRESPVYLAAAFPIAAREHVQLATALIALGGGVLAALAAALPPLLELRGSGWVDSAKLSAERPVQRIGARASGALAAFGALLVIGVTVLVLADSSLTILGGILLALATPCFVPALFGGALRLLKRAGARARGSMLSLAAIELRATATRSVALIGVAALAVYGSVAIQGARADLGKGLDAAVVQFLDTAPVWVSTNNNFLTINNINKSGEAAATVARASGVAAVRAFDASLLDVGDRRLWIRARSAAASHLIQASQLLHGNLATATARLRAGGWATVSNQFASERGLHVGDSFTLPTPKGSARFRVAAVTTNAGWSPGAITLPLPEYRRYWGAPAATALEVSLKPGVSAAAGRASVARALAPRFPGLQAQTLAQRQAAFEASAREGLRSLGQISTLLLITAALAVATVLSASIWQRRARLAALKAQGFDHVQLWRAVVLESGVAVAIGCLDGALLGLYGHALASRWLSLSTGFPAPFSLGLPGIAVALAIVAGITVLLVALLGFQSARVAPDLAFQEQG